MKNPNQVQQDRMKWLQEHFKVTAMDDFKDEIVIEAPPASPTKQPKQMTPGARRMKPQYRQGKSAFRDGMSRDENPYPANTLERALWVEGFNMGEHQLKQQRERDANRIAVRKEMRNVQS